MNAITIWKNLLQLDAEKEEVSQRDANPLKRKTEENGTIVAKILKAEQIHEIQENRECLLEKQIEKETLEQGDFITEREKFQAQSQNNVAKAIDAHDQNALTFRVSCRCSGAVAQTCTAQVCLPPDAGPMFYKNQLLLRFKMRRKPYTEELTVPKVI